MVRRGTVGLAFVILTVGAIAFLSVAATPATADEGLLQTAPEGFSNAEFEVRVNSDGSARWTVRASRPLDNQSEIDQFREFAEEFETTETAAFGNFRTRANRLVAFGTNATGREMNATDFERNARVVELGQTRGVVELSFRWTNFARTDGQRIIVDDVFEGGMFVDSGQRLVFAHGEGLVFQSVDPPPDSQTGENLTASETVTWFGKRNFADRHPEVVYVPSELADGDATTPSPASGSDGEAGSDTDGTTDGDGDTTATPTAGPGTEGSLGWFALVALVVVVLFGVGGGYVLYTGKGAGESIRQNWHEAILGTDAESDTATEAAGTASGASAGTQAVEEELLSDEDRVLQLLDENGGRMKQVEIVEATDWSKSKVSMLLSDMEEEGTISKLRVGRENIISKAGHEPEAAGSPFDE